MNDLTSKRIFIFSGISFVFLVICSLLYYINRSVIILNILMLTPMISVILSKLITKEGFKDLLLKPNFKGNVKWYLIAYLVTPLIAYLGAALFFVMNFGQLDLLNSEFAIKASITNLEDYYMLLLTTIPIAIILNPIFGLILCFGEELAWRGYLLTKLCEKTSSTKATLISSFIWGLWHTPIVLTGFNYGTSNIVMAVVAMVIFCMVLGIIEAFLFFKTKSIWAAVVFHASINGMDLWSPSALLMSNEANPFIGPDLVGIVGGMGFIILSIVCFISIRKNYKTFKICNHGKQVISSK